MLRQLCDDASDSVLIENGFQPNSGATSLFSTRSGRSFLKAIFRNHAISQSRIEISFSMRAVSLVLMMTLRVSGPLVVIKQSQFAIVPREQGINTSLVYNFHMRLKYGNLALNPIQPISCVAGVPVGCLN